MTDDISWFWAGEHARDEILRDSVDSLQAELSRSSRQSSRLSSQLADLKGSIEARLSALSVAFDAYVELGDIREQLAGYPDTSQIRREVRDALTAVTDGRAADPIDDRGLPYWLPPATNAVLALAAGSRDQAAEESARSLAPDAELFMVATAGAIGQGATVRDRVSNLLIGDGALSEPQIALFRAASVGLYGEPVPVLTEIGQQLQPALAAVPVQDWTQWVRDQAGDSPTVQIRWLGDLVAGTTRTGKTRAQPVVSPQDQLRAIVSELAGRGVGDEAALLRRAKQLRQRIEAPTAAAPQHEDAAEPRRSPAVDVVRTALVELPADAAARPVLLGWSAAPLTGVLEAAEAATSRPPSFAERVSSPAGAVEVGPQGADARVVGERVAKLKSLEPAPIWLYGFAAATVVAVVIAVVMLVVGNTTAAVLLFFLAGVGAVGALYQLRESRTLSRETEDNLTRLHAEIGEAQTAAQKSEREWRDQQAQTRLLVDHVRSGLTSVAAPTADLR